MSGLRDLLEETMLAYAVEANGRLVATAEGCAAVSALCWEHGLRVSYTVGADGWYQRAELAPDPVCKAPRPAPRTFIEADE